jgi:hypothetical protein
VNSTVQVGRFTANGVELFTDTIFVFAKDLPELLQPLGPRSSRAYTPSRVTARWGS